MNESTFRYKHDNKSMINLKLDDEHVVITTFYKYDFNIAEEVYLDLHELNKFIVELGNYRDELEGIEENKCKCDTDHSKDK